MQNSISNDYSSNIKAVIAIFIISLITMFRQIIEPAYFSVMINDAFTYSSWAWQFNEALREGIKYPRWMPLDSWGYGSPTFVVYPPLSFYFTAVYASLGASITTAMNLTRFTAMFVSGLGMYFLVKEVYSIKAGVMAAVFFMLNPYNIMQYYIMGSFASTISYMWFSPIICNLIKYFKTKRYTYMIYISLFYAALILTHIINAYMFTFVIIAFIIYLSLTNKELHFLIGSTATLFLGVLISSVYVMPLAIEKSLVNFDTFFTHGSGFYYADFFVLPKMTDKVPPSLFWPIYYNAFVVTIIFFCILVLLLSVPIYRKTNNYIMHTTYNLPNLFIAIISVSMFMLFGPSSFAWEYVPFLKYVHYPVRWLNISAFIISLLFASYCHVLYSRNNNKELYVIICLLFMTFICCDFYFICKANIFTEKDLLPIRAEYSSRDHIPISINVRKLDKDVSITGKMVLVQGEGKVDLVEWKSSERLFNVSAKNRPMIRVRTFNFPGWTAYVDDKQSGIKTEVGTGAMLINLPEGKHQLKVVFEDTPVRKLGMILSLVTAMLVLISLLWILIKYAKKVRN